MLPLVLLSAILALACSVDAHPANVDVQRDTPQAGITEFLTVTQKTRISRRRRAAVDHVEFPPTMEYNLKFDNREIDVVLKRNVYMTSDIALSSNGEKIAHDLGRKTGLYQDRDTKSAFVVQCEDFTEHCTLRGSITVDGFKWDITPEGQTEKLHRAVKTDENVKLSFVPKAPSIPGEEFIADAQEKPDHASRRQKRSTDYTECLVVENLAIVDESIWEFHVNQSNGNEVTARMDISTYYLAIYLQADLHFDFANVRRNGSCIRLYLSSVEIQKLRNESWSGDNEIDVAGARIAYVKGIEGLVSCGADAAAIEGAAYDLVQCFTRKDITYDDTNNGINDPKRAPRSLGFRETACNSNRTNVTSQIVESFGDMIDLLVAHEVALGLGAKEDLDTDCFEEDGYIMAAEQVINDDDLKLVNVWYFSPCTLDQIYDYLHDYNQSECLLDNDFTPEEFDFFDNEDPAGTVFSATEQCIQSFGNGSVPCDPEGQNRTYLPDMCSRGMFCTEVEFGDGNCTGQTRPFDGTPCDDFEGACSKSVCVAKSRLGEACTGLDQCAATNSVCDPTTLICECPEGFYDDDGATIGGSCVLKVGVNEACPQPDACLDPNAFCDSGNCTCNAGYYADSGACSLLKCLGEVCTDTTQCRGTDVECVGVGPSRCGCPTDKYFDVGLENCLNKKALNESCEPGQCLDANSLCNPLSNTCTCAETFAEVGSVCERVCPNNNWVKFNDSCYLFATTELVFSAAQTYCDQFDTLYYESNLVEWESVEELNFLKTTMNDTVPQPTNGFWNDLFETTTNGNETFFTSGVKPAPELLDWNGDNPDDLNGLQLCTMFFKQFNYEQADIECLDPRDGTTGSDGRTAFPICKIPLQMEMVMSY